MTVDQFGSEGDARCRRDRRLQLPPPVEDSEAAMEGVQAREATEDAVATPIAQDPPVSP